jgi:large subunit ribosomal protein L35
LTCRDSWLQGERFPWRTAFALSRLRYPAVSDAEDEDSLGPQEALPQDGHGKLRARHAYSTHILEKKSPKRKRHFADPVEISRPTAAA